MRALTIALLVGLVGGAARATDAPAENPAPPEKVRAPDGFADEAFLRNTDGTVTWFYLTNHVAASQLKKALDDLKIQGLKTVVRERRDFSIKWHEKDKRSDRNPPAPRSGPDENLLILNFPPDLHPVVEIYLERFDIPVPQVHIKAKVVEVTLDRNLEYGTSLFFDKQGATESNPNTFFEAFRTSFRPSSFSDVFLSPSNTGIGISFGDDKYGTFSAQIEALEEKGVANILSEPSIVALQGQLATLITGQETPISDIQITGTTERVITRFKETGIRLDFTPLHIGREFVRMRIRPEVSSITSFIEITSGDTTTQTPVIAQRNAETVVTIRDKMTLVIGGLYSVSEIDAKSGVPLLGDIPVLGFFFSRTRKNRVKSELSFFITPTILRHRLDKSVFTPPMERERLEEARKKREEEEEG